MTPPAWHEEPISRSHDRKTFDCGDAVPLEGKPLTLVASLADFAPDLSAAGQI